MICLFIFLLSVFDLPDVMDWYDPAKAGFSVISGQAMPEEPRENIYHRLPEKYKGVVCERVWERGKRTAGESICFKTDSKEIVIRYQVKSAHAMPHMPATGVSGLDLYTSDDGKEIWLAAQYEFKDTISYRYGPVDVIDTKEEEHGYTLFLPLYNEVLWMEIGVEAGASFQFERPSGLKPIVAYGTSICQGACASRPAMAWTNILHRRLGVPVINLGFSGSAMHEDEVIDILPEIDAAVYILDGMPNSFTIPAPELKDTLMRAVRRLRARCPETPIVLTDHLGYPQGKVYKQSRDDEKHAMESLEAAYRQLVKEGVKRLYRLRHEDIGMTAEMTVEGIHVSDYGMTAYADAYEKLLRKIKN